MLSSVAAAASSATAHANAVLAVCPIAPPGAQVQVDKITGYMLWGVGLSFLFGLVLSIGGVVAGKALKMPHASQASVVGVIVTFVSAIAYVVLPGVLHSILGSGCI